RAEAGRQRRRSDRVRAVLPGADADRLFDGRYEDLAVADPARMGGLLDGFDGPLDHRVFHDDLDLHLRQEIDDVFRAAVQFGVALLTPDPLSLGHGYALDADLVKRLLHLVELERLNDRLDLFHHNPLSSCGPGRFSRQSIPHASIQRDAGFDFAAP